MASNAVVAFLPEGSRDLEEPGPDRIEPLLRVRCFTPDRHGRLVAAEGGAAEEPPVTLGPDARQRALDALRAEVRATRSKPRPEPTQADTAPTPAAAPAPIAPFPE